jgi:hypothetical protein
VDSTAGLFCLEDPDQQDEDQNDQENGAKSDVHTRLPPFGRPDDCSPPVRLQTGKKPGSRRVLRTMTGKFVLRLGLVALFLVAFLAAFTQLLAGRRPVLLGGTV